MEEQVFYSPQGREIKIRIDHEVIYFYHGDNVRRHQRWMEEQVEMGNEVSEEEKNISEFYWIMKKEWISDRTTTRQGREDNWHTHMAEKNWFTVEMKKFIDANT